jgi:DNA-binding NtrC family response regulator
VVDDEPDDAAALRELLLPTGIDVVSSGSAEEALALLENEGVDLVVADLGLPGADGIELTRELRSRNPRLPIVLVTGSESIPHIVAALKAGATDYLQKPVRADRLTSLVLELLSASEGSEGADGDGTPGGPVFEGMLGVSAAMQEVFDRIARVARTSAPVLIIGESGTGKELVAQAIHQQSRRRGGPFVALHTGAIPKELVASELFGHEKGAFTGALGASEGKFAAAEKGTLFLDEIGTMDLPTQISLLRVLETYRYNRVGASRERSADVRIVAATNSDLMQEVQQGRFREDLFYRLSVLTIVVPPLRERREDIVPLAGRFLDAACERFEVEPKTLSPEAMDALLAHPWPGNVRELRNAMDQVAVFANAKVVKAEELELIRARLLSPRAKEQELQTALPESEPAHEAAETSPAVDESRVGEREEAPPPAPAEGNGKSAAAATPTPTPPIDPEHPMLMRIAIGTPLAEVEKMVVLRTLEVAGGNKQRAARILGISRRGLYVKLVAYGEHAPTT